MTADELAAAVGREAGNEWASALAKIKHCLSQLTDEQVWWRSRPSLNSIGNLILHLCGNVRQWVVAGRILGCGDGPASFNAEATVRGHAVVSCDPVYAFSPAEIERRLEDCYADLIAQVRSNPDRFVVGPLPRPGRSRSPLPWNCRTEEASFGRGFREARVNPGGAVRFPFGGLTGTTPRETVGVGMYNWMRLLVRVGSKALSGVILGAVLGGFITGALETAHVVLAGVNSWGRLAVLYAAWYGAVASGVGGAVGTILVSTKVGGVVGAAVGTAIVLVLLLGRTTTADDLWSAAVLICSSLLSGGLASYVSQGEIGGGYGTQAVRRHAPVPGGLRGGQGGRSARIRSR
jgi:hypothetical protein